ncbi:MAG: zinc ribbon domain-containing protein [Desulfobacterales bacterium]|jgi:hypothetical protein
MMICPQCGFEQTEQNDECQRCGVIFEKYRKLSRIKPNLPSVEHISEAESSDIWLFIKRLSLYVKPEANPLIFGGRVLIFIIMFLWGLKFILTPFESHCAMDSFWHLVNLPFHEAGHLFFRPFGRFMATLGGSLGQLLMPLVCLAVFLFKARDTFAASFALWWFAESFMDLAPYINDARSLTLPLLGGNTGRTSPYGFHDWEFILKELGLTKYDHVLAHTVDKLGMFLMICALVWGGYLLYKQYINLKS